MRPAALLLLATAAFADSMAPWKARDVASPGKRHVLHAERTEDRRMRFELRAGDKVLASGVVDELPDGIHVLDAEPAAVLCDQYGKEGVGNVLSLIDRRGKLKWSLTLRDLYEGASFPSRMGRVFWKRAWWVDELRGRVVVVARGGHVREIDLKDGEVHVADKAAVLGGITLPWARKQALELAAELQPKGLRTIAAPIAADASQPAGIRLRATIAAGGTPSVDLFEEAARHADVSEQRYVFGQAAKLLGDEAPAYLEQAALRPKHSYQAIVALETLGEKAGPTLARLVAHGDLKSGPRQYAAEQLGKLPGSVVVADIVRQMADADAEIGGALLTAAIRTRTRDLYSIMQMREDVLLKCLDKRTAPVGWLADYFRTRPTTEAVKPLLKALAKHRNHPVNRTKIIGALKTCTGLDFGRDVDAWLKKTPR